MTNYITHLNATFGKFCADDRLSPLHISLYFSLFQFWNLAKFRNPISINRAEIMTASKIGSANTYTKCMKELHAWGYIRYDPSHNPLIGSKIHLYIFDKTNHKTTNNAADLSAGKSNAETVEKAVRPSINNPNKSNKQKHENEYEPGRRKNNRVSAAVAGKRSQRKKVAPKKVEAEGRNAGRKSREQQGNGRPTLQKLKDYFAGNQWPGIEAEKFFNYFQSNGWLVGGKTPMQDWKAAANNWMLNTDKFSNGKIKKQEQSGTGRAGKLHAHTGKDYSEPL